MASKLTRGFRCGAEPVPLEDLGRDLFEHSIWQPNLGNALHFRDFLKHALKTWASWIRSQLSHRCPLDFTDTALVVRGFEQLVQAGTAG